MNRNLGRNAKNQEYQQRGARPVRGSYPDENIMPDNDEYFLTPEFLNNISKVISATINRNLTSMELRSLQTFIKDMPAVRFLDEQGRQRPAQYMLKSIAYEFMNAKFLANTERFNTHVYLNEELQRQIGDNPQYQRTSVVQGGQAEMRESLRNNEAQTDARIMDSEIKMNLGIPENPETPDEKTLVVTSKINDVVKHIDSNTVKFNNYTDNGWSQNPQRIAYVPFDSRFRDLSFNEVGKIRFTPTVAPELGNTNGQIKLNTPLQNIIKITIEAPFYIPTESVDYSVYERVRLGFSELRDLGSITQTSTEFLFEFKANVQGQKVFLDPTNREILFRNAITVIETVTLEFRDPFDLIPFFDDRLQFVITAGSNPMLLTTVDGVPHNVQTGDVIYFNDPIVPTNNFVATPTNDLLNEIVNSPAGYKATKLNNTQLTVPVDLSAQVIDVLQIVYFGSKRIIFRMGFVMNELAGEN